MNESTKIKCPSCGQHYSIDTDSVPATVTCQICQTQFQADASESAPAVVAQPSLRTGDSPGYRPPHLRPGFSHAKSGHPPLWKKLFEIRSFLSWLSDGSLIKNVTAGFLYLGCLLTVLTAFAAYLQGFELFKLTNSSLGLLGLVLWTVMFPYGVFLAISTIWIRAGEIRTLPPGEFAVSPILAILILLPGEIILILSLVCSIPIGLFVIAGYSMLAETFGLGMSGGPLWGLLAILLTALTGYTVYLITRWLQEFLFVFPSIARNVDLIESHLNTASAQTATQ
jgi:hypothetical protein